ncbi:hypothetical protein [Jeotgalibacillus terrae]|uniref:Uncharacterized protein n=1 Tax=Jeotgalibacillus terrae TaxID=587735 RepID=A0ABW5ZEC8_9BACL|nr:hypothetical protein [Jeotgalibacillus terrae]MBM7577701.1 hypothetical protein [Jeotgalibacillus terrae]
MKMSALEENFHQAGETTKKAISDLADAALQDSDTYQEAIKKLKEYRWKMNGEVATFIIESAVEVVREKALQVEIKHTAPETEKQVAAGTTTLIKEFASKLEQSLKGIDEKNY